jgi:hypothetical protein
VHTAFQLRDVEPEWLTAVLQDAGVVRQARVRAIDREPIDEEKQVTGQVTRLHIHYDPVEPSPPRSLIAKSSSPDPQTRKLFHGLGFYEREVRFYRQIGPDRLIRTPRCYYSALDSGSGRSLLILEDLGSTGSYIAGCSPVEAEAGIRALGSLHAAWWEDPRIDELEWLRLDGVLSVEQASILFQEAWQPFMNKLSAHVREEAEVVGEWLKNYFGECFRYMHYDAPRTLIHNDYHPDNLAFINKGHKTTAAVFDWQLVTGGHGVLDVAWLLGAMNPIDRRAHETNLLRTYHSLVTGNGVPDYSIEQCWTDYKLAILYAIARIATAVGHGGIPPKRERQLCDIIFVRYCTAARDLDSPGATTAMFRS